MLKFSDTYINLCTEFAHAYTNVRNSDVDQWIAYCKYTVNNM